MKTVVSEKDLEEMFYDNYVEHYLIEQSNGLKERSFSSKIFTSQANFREFYVDDLYIGFGDLNLKQPIALKAVKFTSRWLLYFQEKYL